MPTILPKTGIKITRETQNLSNPADAVVSITAIIYEGLASLDDASGNNKVETFFPEGTQEAKKYLVYCEPSWGVRTDDIIELNETTIGDNQLFISSTDNIKMKVIVPKRVGALKILGARHIEAFCYSNN